MSDVGATVEAVFRMESARIVSSLVRLTGDVGLAEDLAQEAVAAALEKWPGSGVPDNPGAWLLTTARNRALDEIRRRRLLTRKHDEIEREAPVSVEPDAAALDEPVADDVLRLMLVACHPLLPQNARVALTLRLVAGLTTAEIARAFLVPEPTLAQRLVRARRTLQEAHVPFEVPTDLRERLGPLLEVIYLVFNEGYLATAGADWMRPAMAEEAMRLGRILAGLVPDEAEVHGLVALMELQASRSAARLGPTGEPVLLMDQDRSRWDQYLIRRGLSALDRAEALAAPLGTYALQAAIAACHARARTAAETDWTRIVALYDALAERTGSPVVELNRAVAVAMAFGPAEGLALVDALAGEPALRSYHLLPAVRGDLLVKLGRIDEARAELERAAFLAKNERDRALLLSRVRALG